MYVPPCHRVVPFNFKFRQKSAEIFKCMYETVPTLLYHQLNIQIIQNNGRKYN